MTKETRTDIQIYSAIAMLFAGVALATAGKTPKDTRTPKQKEALEYLLTELHEKYPNAKLYGHRELVCSLKRKDPHYDCSRCKGL